MTDPLDTMLDTLRTDVPEMSDRAFEAGRARVQAVVDPIPVATTLEPEPVVVALPGRRPLRSPPRRLVRLVASAAAVVALAVGVVAVQSGGDQAPVASAAAALNEAADNITATDPPVGPGQYRYVAVRMRHVDWWLDPVPPETPPSTLYEHRAETWVPHDPNQEWLRRDTGVVDESVNREQRAPCGDYRAAHENREPCTYEGTWSLPTLEFIDRLPRDPAALFERLRSVQLPVGAGDGGRTPLATAVLLLRTGLVPADLRAALYRAFALMPELEITDELANLDGRVGMALGIAGDGMRQDLIVDIDTGQYIGERVVTTEAGHYGPAETITSYSAVRTAVVDEIGVPPAS